MVRYIEFKADEFSVNLGYGLSLRDGLVAIHVNNQANLNPDWIYSFFKFDHPPMIERLNAIDNKIKQMAEKKTGGKSVSMTDAVEAYEEIFKESMEKKHGEQLKFADKFKEGINAEMEGGNFEGPNEYMGFKKITEESLIIFKS